MAHILITGGNGFIGSHLVDTLAESGHHHLTVLDLYPRPYNSLPEGVRFVQGNLRNTNLVRRTLVDQGIEVVYHIAWTTIHETSLKNPSGDIEQNLVPTVDLLEACVEAGVKRVIFISSGGTVYGVPQQLPLREDHPTNPITAYGVTKLAVEKYIQMYQHLHGLDYVIYRPSVPYGPYQNPRRRQGAVTVFTYRALRGEPIVIWGDGEITRDYFFIGDMSTALMAALDLPQGRNAILNLGGGRGYSLNQLIQVIETTLDINIQVEYAPGRKFDVPQLQLDTQAAAETLNWQPKVELPVGIQRTADWIQRTID